MMWDLAGNEYIKTDEEMVDVLQEYASLLIKEAQEVHDVANKGM
jgi:hypothetical protein